MATESEVSFGASLDELGVSLTRVEPSGFADAVSEAIEPPAVGVELAEMGVSLEATPVTVDPTPADVRDATTGVTAAVLGIGEYGTTVLPADGSGSEFVGLFVDRHVVVLRESALVDDMETAVERLGDRFREDRGDFILATGPSATADMGALVKGAHGPSDVHVIVLEGE